MPVYLREHEQSHYIGRTKFNAAASDLTIAFTVNPFTAGERLTRQLATEAKYMHIDLSSASPAHAADGIRTRIASQFDSKRCDIINIAGNGVYTLTQHGLTRHGWNQDKINEYLIDVFSELKERWPSTLPAKGFRSGGQTGVDIAAAVMAYTLGFDAVITFPRGYRQRGINGKDFTQTREDIMLNVINMAKRISKMKEGGQ